MQIYTDTILSAPPEPGETAEGSLLLILRDVAARDVERGRHLWWDQEPGAECRAKERARFQRVTRLRDGGWEGGKVVSHPQLQVAPSVGALVGSQEGSVSAPEWGLGRYRSAGVLPHSVRWTHKVYMYLCKRERLL